jgi:hypothetical protein
MPLEMRERSKQPAPPRAKPGRRLRQTERGSRPSLKRCRKRDIASMRILSAAATSEECESFADFAVKWREYVAAEGDHTGDARKE